MSLCYDFQKWTIITMLAVLAACLVSMVSLVYGQETNETRTFKNCYSNFAVARFLFIQPSINLTDT
jgi:hypothetical protein